MGFMYILECSDGTFYTGSTRDLQTRIEQHNRGEGARYTARRLPVRLVYSEEYERIDQAFYREKQVQNWSHQKKESLVEGRFDELPRQAGCRNLSHHKFRNLREV
ncbi:MAG TPA: GIY-YIG nuclease family protein [Turneriella sp.]|nr:GIY-YIG nuclease family protein [Turneriella sp.]